jgi:periplasmic protein TonB
MTGLQLIANGREQLKRPVMFSAGAHVGLAAGILAATLIHGVPTIWGEAGGGGAATVNLVSSASVPLPPPTVPTTNTVATENKGLNYTEPQPKPTVKTPPDDKAVALPAKNAKMAPPEKAAEKPKVEESPAAKREIASTGTNASEIRPTRRYKQAEEPVANNEVPYGEGGAATGPYGMFQADGGSGGVQVTGDVGDFNARFSWYVTAIRNRISSNWLKATVDPSIRSAPRVYVAFQIYRDGRVVNPQLTASSGLPSLDRSALRAVYDSSPMPPLPPDFPGSVVAVQFWFDFKR